MSAAYCRAAPGHPVHAAYHDLEYGFPSSEERVLFERLVLEINQAGLSWLTILNKRAAFRAAYRDFDVDRVAEFGSEDISRLLGDPGIVRNRLKIEAAIDNARRIQELRRSHGGVRALARRASSALGGGMDQVVSPDLPLYRRANRQRIFDEPRLSARGARAGLPGLCANCGIVTALDARLQQTDQ